MQRRTGFTALLVLVVTLMGLQLVLRQVFTGAVLPTRKAQWIWLSKSEDKLGPVAFYAIRDFHLAETPTRAMLTAAADEEALIFLNSIPIGGARYANGGSLRLYQVQQALRKGANRLVVEVRSVRGVGGLLLRLAVELGSSERVEIVTDGDWTLFPRSPEALFDDSLPLDDGERPHLWGPAPAGRWLLSSQPEPAPTIAELRTASKAMGALRFRLPPGTRRWQTLAKTDRSSPALGNWVVFDFGREVMGYLALRFPARAGKDSRPVGLLYLGRRPRILNRSTADEHVVAMQGQRVWLDARPRRFRYATYVGLTPVSGADAYPVDEVRADEVWPIEEEPTGPFGLPVADLGPSLEDEVWSELHRLSSVADRE